MEAASFTAQEYVKIRELGGKALVDILVESSGAQIDTFCELAEREFALHGDTSFVRKSLDAALERVPAFETDYHYGYASRPVHAKAEAYIKIARTAHATDQDEGYVGGILQGAATTVHVADPEDFSFPSQTTDILCEVGDAAAEIQAPLDFRTSLAQEVYDRIMLADNKGSRVEALHNFMQRTQAWDLDPEYRLQLIEKEREHTKAQESSDDRIDGLLWLIEIAHDEENPDYARGIIEDAEAAAAELADPEDRCGVLLGLAVAAEVTKQPNQYTRVLISAGLGEQVKNPAVLTDFLNRLDELSEDINDNDIRMDMDAFKKKLIQVGFVAVAVSRIKHADSSGLSNREKHQLLNQVLGKFEVSEELLESNGIERRPYNYAFAD